MKKLDLGFVVDKIRPLTSLGRKDALSRLEHEMDEAEKEGTDADVSFSDDSNASRRPFKLPSVKMPSLFNKKGKHEEPETAALLEVDEAEINPENFSDDLAFKAAKMAAQMAKEEGKKPSLKKKEAKKQAKLMKKQLKEEQSLAAYAAKNAAKKSMKPEAALAIAIAVYGLGIAGAWKGMEYGIDMVKKERLLGRASSQSVQAPIKIQDLPLLSAIIADDQTQTRLPNSANLRQDINEIFSPTRLMNARELEIAMAALGLDINGQPLPPPPPPPPPPPEPVAPPVDYKMLYTAMVKRSFIVDSISPGAGAFLNGRWISIGDIAKEEVMEGSAVVVSLKSVSDQKLTFDVNGLSISMDTAS